MVSYFHSHVLIQITIYFFLFLHTLSPTKANLVTDVCKDAKNPPSCVSALMEDPKAPSTTDLKALAKIALNLAISNTTNSQKYVENMAQQSNEPTLEKALEKCVFGFKHTIDSFYSALQELDEEILGANYDIMVAGDGARWCEEGLAVDGLKVDSISTRDNYIFLFSNIGDVITSRLLSQD